MRKTIDFQFDFARIPPLPVPKETSGEEALITPDITTESASSTSTTFAYNASDLFEELTPENPIVSFEPIANLEEIPHLEEPYQTV